MREDARGVTVSRLRAISDHLFGTCVECKRHPAIGPMGYCGACFHRLIEEPLLARLAGIVGEGDGA